MAQMADVVDSGSDRSGRVKGNRVEEIHLASGSSISARSFINAAGPFVKEVGQLIGVDLPISHELHVKIALKDYSGYSSGAPAGNCEPIGHSAISV